MVPRSSSARKRRSPGSRRRARLGSTVAAALLALPVSVRAEEPARPVVVLLVATEGQAPERTILDPVQAELGDLPVALAVELTEGFPATLPAQVTLAAEIAARRAAGMVFWFDVSLPGQVFVYLAEPGGSRVLVRAVEATDLAERVQSAAVIVRGLVKAVLDGGTIGIQPAPGAPAPVAPVEPPAGSSTDASASTHRTDSPDASIAAEAPTSSWLGLQLAYGLDFFSDQARLLHGLDAGLLFHVHEHWSLFATYRILFDAETSGAGMDLDVARHPLQLGVRFHWSLGDWDVGGSVAGVLDYVTAEVASRSPDVAAVAPADTWLGGIGLLAHVSYRIAGTFRVFLDEGLDVLFNRVEFVVDRGDESTLLLRSWYASPRILLGLRVDLL